MNKYFALVLLAVAVSSSLVAAHEEEPYDEYSQTPLIPNDEAETAHMSEKNRVLFGDFCLQARDEFKAHMGQQVNEGAAKVFNVLFNTLSGIATEALQAQSEAVERGITALKNGEQGLGAADEDADGKISDEELTEKIAQEAENAHVVDENGQPIQAGLLRRFADTVIFVVRRVVKAACGETALYLNRVKSQLNFSNINEVVDAACNTVTVEIKKTMTAMFSQTKTDLERSAMKSKQKDLQQQLQTTTLENVGCLTTKRVLSINKWCNIVTKVAPILAPMLSERN